MLISGKIQYKNDPNNYVNFTYDLEKLVSSKKEIDDNCDNYVEIYWYDIDEIEEKVDYASGKFIVENVEFTKDEHKLGLNYLNTSWPRSCEFCNIGIDEIEEMLYIEYMDSDLTSVVKMVIGYLEGYTGVYGDNTLYELLDSEMEYQKHSRLEYNKDKGYNYDNISYIEDCYSDKYATEFDDMECISYEKEYDLTNYVSKEFLDQLETIKEEIWKLYEKSMNLAFEEDKKFKKNK